MFSGSTKMSFETVIPQIGGLVRIVNGGLSGVKYQVALSGH